VEAGTFDIQAETNSSDTISLLDHTDISGYGSGPIGRFFSGQQNSDNTQAGIIPSSEYTVGGISQVEANADFTYYDITISAEVNNLEVQRAYVLGFDTNGDYVVYEVERDFDGTFLGVIPGTERGGTLLDMYGNRVTQVESIETDGAGNIYVNGM